MSDAFWQSLFQYGLPSFFGFLASLLALWAALTARGTHKAVNSRMDKFLEQRTLAEGVHIAEAREASFAEGKLAGGPGDDAES